MRRTALALLPLLVCLTGCGSEPASPPPTAAVDELGEYGGPCPDELPGSREPGLGTGEPAAEAPTLPAYDRAWVCRYQPEDAQGPAWTLDGEPRELTGTPLDGLRKPLSQLAPALKDRMCTADAGPRYLLVLADGQDLTGVLVDAYGCREVRLTEQPHTVVAGDGEAPGVLQGPAGLLDLLTAPTA